MTVATVATTATAANPSDNAYERHSSLRGVFFCVSLRELKQLTMKRVILSLVALVAAVSMGAQAPEQAPAQDEAQQAGGVKVRAWRGPQSNHTVSTTLGLGLEYGFEWEYVERATLVARIGYVSKDFTLRNALDNFQWSTTMSPAVTLEPRFYFWMDREATRGRYTAGFVGVPTQATLAKDAKGLGELAVSPVVGVRRVFAKHWFHEFTAGADLLCLPVFIATPHVGYRIGFLF